MSHVMLFFVWGIYICICTCVSETPPFPKEGARSEKGDVKLFCVSRREPQSKAKSRRPFHHGSICQIPSHPEPYGLGIRTAIYLRWFGIPTASWLLKPHALDLKLLNALSITATSAGLVFGPSPGMGMGTALQLPGIYIILPLASGTIYASVPLYARRDGHVLSLLGRPPPKASGMLMLGAMLGPPDLVLVCGC